MLEIKGKISTAICYANVIEEEAIEQIRRESIGTVLESIGTVLIDSFFRSQ